MSLGTTRAAGSSGGTSTFPTGHGPGQRRRTRTVAPRRYFPCPSSRRASPSARVSEERRDAPPRSSGVATARSRTLRSRTRRSSRPGNACGTERVNRASTVGRGATAPPPNATRNGSTIDTKPQNVATGGPERRNTGRDPTVATPVDDPGRTRTRRASIRAFGRASTARGTTSRRPTLLPPIVRTTSHRRSARTSARRIARVSSDTVPRSTASTPSSSSAVRTRGPDVSRTPPGRIRCPWATISVPVWRNPTRIRRATRTDGTSLAYSAAMCQGRRRVPAVRRGSPGRKSSPRRAISRPTSGRRRSSMRPGRRRQSSVRTTVFAPRGTGAPVSTSTAVFALTGGTRRGSSPGEDRPTTRYAVRTRRSVRSPAGARKANPSMVARSYGGSVRRARISERTTRPRAVATETTSVPRNSGTSRTRRASNRGIGTPLRGTTRRPGSPIRSRHQGGGP